MKNFADAPIEQLAPNKIRAEELLAINAPELLFKQDDVHVRAKKLKLAWHPDRAKRGDVFKHIAALEEQAEKKLESGWELHGKVSFSDDKGGIKTFPYAKSHSFELGEMYIAEDAIIFAVQKSYTDLFQNAQQSIGKLNYANADMQKMYAPRVPQIREIFEAPNRHVMVIEKDPKLVLLSDLQQHHGGKMDGKQTCWVMSRLHDIACFTSYNNVAHNAISTNTVFVAPETHMGAVMGGWWYAVPHGSPLVGLPQSTVEIAPPGMLDSGMADKRLDLTLIRGVGRTLMGDKTGMRLPRDKDVPKPLSDWLTLPPRANARDDYKSWEAILTGGSMGPRKFVPTKGSFAEIYQQRSR